MIDSNPMRAVCNYGSSAAYKDPPTEEQIRCGVIPLDSLPAAWWNWLWNETNGAVNEARSAMTTVITELNNVLCCAGITPQSACMDQLYNAIVCLRQATATSSVAGSVKSSSTCGQVSVDSNGLMTANGLGNASNLSTTAKTNVVAAINELKSVYDSCFTATAGSIQSLENSKLATNGCAVDSAKLEGTTKAGLFTGFSCSNNKISATIGGTSKEITLGSAAACASTAFLAASGCASDSAKLGGTAKSGLLTSVSFTNGCVGVTVGGTTCSVALGSAASCASTAFLAATGCAADSAKLGGTAKSGLLTGFSCTNNQLSITVGGTTCTASLGTAAACASTAFLASTGCATDSNKLGGTTKAGLLTAFSCANNQMSITVGGTTCTASITIPATCFGTALGYVAFKCSDTGEADAAECRINLGCSRSYRWCKCPTNVCSYDRRTYTYIGTCQNKNACAGMTYIDTCLWQCCYSGTAGVTTCTNRRWCFCGDGSMYTPGKVEAKSSTFGCMLVANRTGSANIATVMFCNCNGELGIIGMSTKDGALQRYKTDHSTVYTILDTSAAVTITQGGTGATTAAGARTNLGLGSAATCAATAFRASTWTPSCVACAGADGSGCAFGTAARYACGCFMPADTTYIARAGQATMLCNATCMYGLFLERFTSGSLLLRTCCNGVCMCSHVDEATEAYSLCHEPMCYCTSTSFASDRLIWVQCARYDGSNSCVIFRNCASAPFVVRNKELLRICGGTKPNQCASICVCRTADNGGCYCVCLNGQSTFSGGLIVPGCSCTLMCTIIRCNIAIHDCCACWEYRPI